MAGEITPGEVAALPRVSAPIDPGAPVARRERRLIGALQRGSADAAEKLVQQHWDAAQAAAYLMVHDAHLAEDIAQEALLEVVRSIGTFTAGKPLRPWVHRIVVNKSIDYLRSPRSRLEPHAEVPEVERDEAVPIGVSDPGIASALMTLDLDDRAAVVLRHVFGYRATEVAELLGEPATSTRSRIHRSLLRLRSEIEIQEATQ